ncbi:MAG: ATP synthase subunit I [Terriglobales bacterium]
MLLAETENGESRIFYVGIVLGVAATAVLASMSGWAAGLGLALGAACSTINYAWLRSGANALMQAAAGGPVTSPMRWGMVRFLTRFALLAACVYAILISGLVPLPPVLGGLFVIPAAAVVEGLRQITAHA